MQMRCAQLPQNCHGQGLAATGIAKTLRRVLLSLFNTQNCRRIVIPSEARNLTIGSVITLASFSPPRSARSFALLRMTASHWCASIIADGHRDVVGARRA